MFSNMKDMMSMAAKAKELQANMKLAQDEVQTYKIDSNDSKNCLSVTISGDFSITDVKIHFAADQATYEQAILEAVNTGIYQMKLKIQARMKEATGGIELPTF